MDGQYNEYDSIFGSVLNGGSLVAPVPEKKEPPVLDGLDLTLGETKISAGMPESVKELQAPKSGEKESLQKAGHESGQRPLKQGPRCRKKAESSGAMIRDFPRPLLNTVKAMFPAGNQTDALVAFTLHALGGKCVHGGYEAPSHVREMVEAADKGTLPGLKAEMTGIGKKLDKLYTGMLTVQFLNVYAMLHDVGVRKRTEGLSQVDMLEDKMFEAMEIIRRDFPEFRQVVEDREHRNTSYFKK